MRQFPGKAGIKCSGIGLLLPESIKHPVDGNQNEKSAEINRMHCLKVSKAANNQDKQRCRQLCPDAYEIVFIVNTQH